MNSKVSVIVPVYNAEKKLSICVDSILRQTYENIEVILVDDGSKDKSFELCQRYAQKDKRVIAIHTENQGSGPARNTGIKYATGKWGYFPDSDDLIADNAINTMVSAVEKLGCDLIVFGFDEKTETGKLIRSKIYPNECLDGKVVRASYENHYIMDEPLCIQGAPWNKMFCLDIVRRYQIEYPDLHRHQDEGFICRYVAHINKVCFIPDKLYTYYANDSAAVNRKYPVDYIDCVKGLFDIRKETILSWNHDNKIVREVIYDELICNMIWSFELSFNEKYHMNRAQRLEWIAKNMNDIDFEQINWGRINRRLYQRNVIKLLRTHPQLAYELMRFKLLVQRIIGR